ncbi:MAG: hypothetical protein WA987_13675 [Cellvibrio sp.]|jgi:hypothetical protein
MPFIKVSEVNSSSEAGNFTAERRKFFNQCGRSHYCGSLKFQDSKHQQRIVPIFEDECLEDKPQTYAILKMLRKAMKYSFEFSRVYSLKHNDSVRSIHQNENGYLPFKDDGKVDGRSVSAPAIRQTALLYGELPNNQAKVGARTKGQFLEYTCGDQMHVECRLIVDYRFGLIYITLGHYNKDSFALLTRSEAELKFEIQPMLPALGVTFID